jgi:hypothetical protein
MEVIIRTSPDETAELTSRLIAARVRAKPDLVLGSYRSDDGASL